jgi:PKD repeat protein
MLSLTASAQFRYSFKDTTSPYVPLSGSTTSVNGTDIWDDDDYAPAVPFTWTLDSTISLNNVFLALGFPGFIADTSDFSDVNGFFLSGADFADRGTLSKTASLSPIRYITTGSAPNRIYKLELFNVGFFNELDSLGTMNDSANMQLWIYEGSNILEVHFGPSRITDPVVDFGGGLLFSFLSHADFFTGTQGMFYYVTDSLGIRGIDSFAISGGPGSNNFPTTWPADGTVFRFTPRWKPCPLPVAPTFTAGAVTGYTSTFTYTGSATGVDSLVWNFGDGKNLTVKTSLTTPVSHTYDTAGHYGVSVRAYNSCGSKLSTTAQTSVSVKSIASLGNVLVYPNPAASTLMIDGMEAGSKAMVYSMTGKLLLRSELSGTKAQLDISALPAGAYSILLSGTDGRNGAVQFIKQ